MNRIDWVEQRLLNWQRWCLRIAGPSGLGYAGVYFMRPATTRGGYSSARVPVDDCEASETDDAVRALPEPLALTVVEYYLGSGGEADHLAILGCACDTLYVRIRKAHGLLAKHFVDCQRRRRAERERVERLAAMVAKKDSL